MKDLANEYRDKPIEQICETDDDLLEQFLEGTVPEVKA